MGRCYPSIWKLCHRLSVAPGKVYCIAGLFPPSPNSPRNPPLPANKNRMEKLLHPVPFLRDFPLIQNINIDDAVAAQAALGIGVIEQVHIDDVLHKAGSCVRRNGIPIDKAAVWAGDVHFGAIGNLIGVGGHISRGKPHAAGPPGTPLGTVAGGPLAGENRAVIGGHAVCPHGAKLQGRYWW